VWGESSSVDMMAFVRELGATGGKHRTEVTEVTEGDWGFVVESSFVNGVAFVREREKHRTEILAFYDPSVVPSGSAKPRTNSAPLILRLPSS
jgi:hypothetical protein